MIRSLSALFLLSLICQSVSAQNWGGGVDGESLHFGFRFQFVSAEYKILKRGDWRSPFFDPETGQQVSDSLYSMRSVPSPGFGLGFVTNLRLNENADFRFTPTFVFSDRLIDYEYLDDAKFRQQKVAGTYFEFPVGLKLKSDRRMNFRAYVLGGAKFSYDIISKKKKDDSGLAYLEKMVKNRKSFLSYEAGIGFDLYFEFFKMSPELKFSQSVGDVLKHENQPYSRPIDKLILRNLQFSLYFE
jgi:hypothetical protein